MDMLDKTLTDQLTAHRLYFIHYQISNNWGYKHLSQRFKEETELSLHHAESIIQRILYFENFPNINQMHMVQNGETCRQQLQLQHDFETKHIKNLKNHIPLCVDQSDLETRELLDEILKTSEQQIDWMETQCQRIRDIGVESYLLEYSHA